MWQGTARSTRWRFRVVRAAVARTRWFGALALLFAFSRAGYFALGVRPDLEPLATYLQYIDPSLLRQHLWQSLLYLREQPPGFNLYLGLVFKATAHPEGVFAVLNLLMGTCLAFALLSLLLRLGVTQWLAFLLVSLFAISPITVLFENWVFYAYPVMLCFSVAAWALSRYLDSHRFTFALLFFFCLASVAAIRGVYHLAWLLLLTAATVLLCRRHSRRTALAACVPVLLVVSFYLKNYVMFGDTIPGQQVYKKMNYAAMVQDHTPPELIGRLASEGKIGQILTLPALETNTRRYASLVPSPPPTGIPLLDMAQKPGGADNWNSLWRARVADLYEHDARIVASQQPGLMWRVLRENLFAYLRPATDVFPFDDCPNANRLRPFLARYELATSGAILAAGDTGEPIAWLNLVLLPLLLCGGLILAVSSLRRRAGRARESRARAALILFAVSNIAYVSAVTVLFSVGDHNRYREEVAPLFVLLLAVLLQWFLSASRRLVSRRHRRQYAE